MSGEVQSACVVQAPLGIGSACTALVGQRLGALQPQVARFTCKVALTLQGKYSSSSVPYTHRSSIGNAVIR